MESSISRTKTPKPCTSCKGLSVNVSPLVLIILISVGTPFFPRRSFTRFACARASLLPRVPIRNGFPEVFILYSFGKHLSFFQCHLYNEPGTGSLFQTVM